MVDRSTIPAVHSSGSILVLYSPMGLPFYSSRDLDQTIEAIKEKDQSERNLNSNLVNLSIPGLFEKYITRITCTDMNAPMIGGVFQGAQVVIDCCCEIGFPASIADADVPTLIRPLATNTSIRNDGNGTKYIYPKLTCLMRGVSYGFKEYPHKYNWALNFEEV